MKRAGQVALGVLIGYMLGYRVGTNEGRIDGRYEAYGAVASEEAYRVA